MGTLSSVKKTDVLPEFVPQEIPFEIEHFLETYRTLTFRKEDCMETTQNLSNSGLVFNRVKDHHS